MKQTFQYENTSPVWSPDATRLLFSSTENSYRNLRTPALKVGKRTDLFEDIYEKDGNRPNANYDVSSDGKRFLMVKANPEAPEPPRGYIAIVTNWIEELKSRLGPTN